MTGRISSDSSSSSLKDSFAAEIAQWKAKVEDYTSRPPHAHLHSGSHLKRFSEFLDNEITSEDEHDVDSPFAVLYDFQKDQPKVLLESPSDLRSLAKTNSEAPSQSQLLFLRGYPTSDWLAAIGSTFDVDPEFLEHHLRLDSSRSLQSIHMWPLLTSNAVKEIRLSVPTLGYLADLDDGRSRKVSHLRKLRASAQKRFGSYLRDVDKKGAKLGASMLRGISVHDAKNFSFEQDISIWAKQTERGWVAIAWLDFGRHNLADGREGPSLLAPVHHDNNKRHTFRPLIFGRFRDTHGDSPPISNAGGEQTPQIQQNAMHLWHNYDHGLDRSLAKLDSLYALRKLFKVAAASEFQFLNMIRHSVQDDVRDADPCSEHDVSMSNLQDHQYELNKHKKMLKDTITALDKTSKWPCSTAMDEVQVPKIESATNDLRNDIHRLVDNIDDILKQCHQGVHYLTNVASLAESRRAITQAASVEFLARLGGVFLPLALLASIFGMNFREFGQGQLPLWIFFAAAGPILVISVFFLVPRIRRLVGSVSLRRRRFTAGRQLDVEMGRLI